MISRKREVQARDQKSDGKKRGKKKVLNERDEIEDLFLEFLSIDSFPNRTAAIAPFLFEIFHVAWVPPLKLRCATPDGNK